MSRAGYLCKSKMLKNIRNVKRVPSSTSGVSHSALDVPMAMAIQYGAARITILEARVAEQDGKIDTLQCLHEGLQREIILRHPSFPLPDPPANATSLLLHQPVPPSMSPPESALPPLIDLSMAGMELTLPKLEDPPAIEGLMFEHSQVEPKGPQMSIE
ncbi:uncharacterized protein HD556DRAFT_1304345 [Suillus plorans]|uniref:Uncharacterized protein n=1 Tax=Suillus plorans TaxID=116603 RepID=A0A9P7DSM9_9AGAM|nr:uncharacterized protein HD556DRAFT_1304345 [Suillus plorans]KAG1802177.1 hypothetical protein HD556DRAFT_1304345 [Suillus plorans]